jgi:TonB-dependent SusC/RagA subfamily outer membrane receptor
MAGQKNPKKLTLTGTVLDEAKMPVIGAAITVDGKPVSGTTGKDGSYKIKVKPGTETIGIFTNSEAVVEEPLAGRTKIDLVVPLEVHQKMMSEMADPGNEAINIGYGTVKRKDLLTPVGKVDARKDRYAGYSNIYDMLRGEVAGVQVSGNSIRIQGASSLMLSTEPLFVVDGSIVSSIADIPPHQVSSVEVLKGSSASIYGSRGANGVILITLKKSQDIR